MAEPRQEEFVNVAKTSGLLAADDAANYDITGSPAMVLVCVQGVNKPVHVRINSDDEASATVFDALIPTTASKDPDVQVLDCSFGGRILVKKLSLYFPAGTTGMDTDGNIEVRALY